MQIYQVGGAVRDRLLGLPVQDRDWVVVGATPEQMAARGFAPVGRDFPVFLHPDTHEEYALARTERKSGRGYRGFVVQASPEVTLEQDLARRDLTINAIAAPQDWTLLDGLNDAGKEAALIDPFGGLRDLRAKVLRHVSEAFREDPVRILRVARFAARFHDFALAPETLALMRAMVQEGEAAHLVPERVWQELARGLMQAHPARMLEVLRDCGALAVILPQADGPWRIWPRALAPLERAARLHAPLSVRFACLVRGLALLGAICERWRVPMELRALAGLLARERQAIHDSGALDAAGVLSLLTRCDAIRKPERFAQALLACQCDALLADAYPVQPRLLGALAAARSVETARIAQTAQAQGAQGLAVGQAIAHARTQAVAQWLQGHNGGGL
ncbi:MAG: multifunctional CCA tRNA nucleotidyl transferase/2'3'-cyclic phosphodiesterase/2'nucleotidase/phosphatase [Burkholderiaceae bacterium]|jgi:tRNA nucleotidyltransferase (CCA-adding enzyme)|nr:multifunctional CCA tRNA nucleotidyl transferase/2'3'-cyclic phosphodiesterase/2'nucleotidase/phosphatase [Burkholderiaceae bacterium]